MAAGLSFTSSRNISRQCHFQSMYRFTSVPGLHIMQSHTCKCGETIDRCGHHALRCTKSAGRYPRHRELNNIIYRTLISLNVSSILEPPGVHRLDGKKADGLTIMPWHKGKSLLWDSTCTYTFYPSNIAMTSKQAG